ncbi:uncharacterized protein PAE49_004972 isoform 2-T2 [Odontesthes bonariensis]|uniref:uncharacterized protein LOC142380468 isoform X2 n=1 Tax=Odontesthes bonariensis TaxID=219752 RepID=UPI003F583C83
MTTQKLLVETLNQLSPEEFDEFKSLIGTKKGSLLALKAANTQDAVRLLAQTYGPQCVEVSREAFRKMSRTDLLQRLSGADSGAKEKRPELSQRVETMESTLELLLETLADLSDGELRAFKAFHNRNDLDFQDLNQLDPSLYSMTNRMFMEMTDLHHTVYSMVQLYGQRSVEETEMTLMEMKEKDLVQRLSNPKKKLHECQSALIHKMAAMLAVKQLLLDTLMELKRDELSRFRWFLHLTQFKMDLPQIPWSKLSDANNREIVDLMVNIYGQHCVEVTRETFMDMNRTDLAQRLPESSFGPKEKHAGGECFPALIHKIKTMESVTELLLEKLAELSGRSLGDFWITFRKTQQVGPHYVKPWMLLHVPNIQDLVFSMVQTYGQQAVEETEKILQEIKKTDQLPESSFGPEKKLSVGEQRGLIPKVATVAAVKQLLLGTLNDLRPEELLKFRRLLVSVTILTFGSAFWSGTESSSDTVDEMVMEFGQQSVELTRKVLEYLNRTDLVQRFLETSSAPNKKLSVGEQRGLIPKVSYLTAVKHLLLETLNDLSDEELNRFRELISQENLSLMLRTSLPADRLLIAYVMVEELNQQSVEVVSETLMEMKKTDLVQRLTDRSSVLKEELSGDEHGAALLKAMAAETADKQILLETLKSLSKTDLLKFTWLLELTCFQRGVPQIPHYKLEYRPMTAGIVNLVVVELGQQWVEMTKEVFMVMNRTDLVQKLSETSSASKGPSGSLKPEGRGSGMQGSGGWTKLGPEVNSSDTDEAPTYSLQSDVGHFECSISGLRWVCKEKVGFRYHFGSWDGHMERMESRRYSPAGPLMDVTVTAGRFDEVHLPHWICIDGIRNLLDNFAVLHITDCGDIVEKVSEVTESHVKLTEPSFTLKAPLMKMGFPVKYKCNVLLYYQPNTPFLNLHVFLVPRDPALQQAVSKKKSSHGYEEIPKHGPDKFLKMKQGFSLTADAETAHVQPEKITLRYDSQDPNFYEVFIKNPDREFNLKLSYTHPIKAEEKDAPVWTCTFRNNDYPKSGPVEAAGSSGGATGISSMADVGRALAEAAGGKTEAEENLSEQLPALMQAATVKTDGERLLELLEELKKQELQEFKWFLKNKVLSGCPPIPASRLEKAETLDVVDLMLRAYTHQSLMVAKKVFKKMKRNDLVEKLPDCSS